MVAVGTEAGAEVPLTANGGPTEPAAAKVSLQGSEEPAENGKAPDEKVEVS